MIKSSSIQNGILLFCSVFLVLTACGRKPGTPQESLLPTPPVNDLVLQNLTTEFPGEIRTADLAGRVQLVLFFRSDDEACQGMVSDWNDLQDQFQSRGFTLVGAVVDNRSPEALSSELADLGLSWNAGLATAPVLKAFSPEAPIHAIPTAFLLSREGQVMRTYAGFVPISLIREDIDLLLNDQELPDRNPKTVAPEDNTA